MSVKTSERWVLVLGTADWNQAIATNQHYMVRELAPVANLTFVESLGLRRPELSRRDLVRAASRLRRGPTASSSRQERPTPQHVEIVSPIVIPVHTGPAKLINKIILRRVVKEWINFPGERVLWTYSPVTYGLEHFASYTVYHCVDLLGEFPGISAKMIAANSRLLAKSGATSIGSSHAVVDELLVNGFVAPLHWPNVADVAVIEAARSSSPRTPRAVFAGNLSANKVDFALLHRLLAAGIELHLAGPIAEGGGDSESEVASLVKAGAIHHGLLSLPDLARLYWTATVGVIPYLINPYTSGVNPLKTYEYLAAGLAVVSTPVPAVSSLSSHVFVESSPQSFVKRVVDVAGSPSIDTVARRTVLAAAHSWQGRGQAARSLLNELSETVSPVIR